MGFFSRTFTRIVSLATAIFLVYGTWRIYDGNGFELAAVAFSAAAILRSVLLAWLRRAQDVSMLFRSKTTAFIRTPLQEAAFLLPIYAAPGAYAQFGLFDTIGIVIIGWVVLRALVRLILERTSGQKQG